MDRYILLWGTTQYTYIAVPHHTMVPAASFLAHRNRGYRSDFFSWMFPIRYSINFVQPVYHDGNDNDVGRCHYISHQHHIMNPNSGTFLFEAVAMAMYQLAFHAELSRSLSLSFARKCLKKTTISDYQL